MLKVSFSFRKGHGIAQCAGRGGIVDDFVRCDAHEIRAVKLEVLLRSYRNIAQILQCLYRERIDLVRSKHFFIEWRMARQILERLTKSPFLILLDLRLGQKLYFRMLFQCSVVFPSISFTISTPSSLPTQTSKLEKFPAKSNSMKKDCYNVITLYLGTSAFIITQPIRYEVAQTQKMMK